MARDSRVTLGLFMAAVLMAFGGNAALGADIEWTGDTSGENKHYWNLNRPAWQKGTQKTYFEQGDNVIFNSNTYTNVRLIEENEVNDFPATVRNMTVDGNYTFTGGSIYSNNGTLHIKGGTTEIDSLLDFSGGAAKVDANAALWVDQSVFAFKSITGAGMIKGSNATLHQTLEVGRGAAIGSNNTFDGVISGDRLGLAKYSQNTLTLTGVNTYGGPTNIYRGTLAVSGSGNLNGNTDVVLHAVSNAGENVIFDLSKASHDVTIGGLNTQDQNAVVLMGGHNLVMKNGGKFNGSIEQADGVVGHGGIELDSGSGSNPTFQLQSKSHDYTGDTIIKSGTLQLIDNGDISHESNSKLVFSGNGVFDVSASAETDADGYYVLKNRIETIGAGTGAININSTGIRFVNGGEFAGDITAAQSGKGNVVINNNGDLFTFAGTNEAGLTTVVQGSEFELGSTGKLREGVLVEGTMVSKGAIENGAKVSGGQLNNSGTIDGGVILTAGGMVNEASGKITSGGAKISGGVMENDGALFGNVDVTGGVMVNNKDIAGNVVVGGAGTAAEFDTANGSKVSGNVTIDRQGAYTAAGTVTGTVTLNGGGVMYYDGGDTYSVGGSLIAESGSNIYAFIQDSVDHDYTPKTITVGGEVDLKEGSHVTVDTTKSGSYTLFDAKDGIKYYENGIHVQNGDAFLIDKRTTADGTTLSVIQLEDEQHLQYWSGKSGDTWNNVVGDKDAYNWSGIYKAENGDVVYSEDPTVWQAGLDNQKGWIGVFGDKDHAGNIVTNKDITVEGRQTFDTLQFTGNNYTISGGALAMWTSDDNAPANIEVNGNTTINSEITGSHKLDVYGGGTLTLTNKNTIGDTTLLEDKTTIVLKDKEALGMNTEIKLQGSDGGLVLDFEGILNNSITDAYTDNSAKNSVVIAKDIDNNNLIRDRHVTFGKTNKYTADTIVEEQVTLTSGAVEAFSEDSQFTLKDRATLDVQNGRQGIAGLTSEKTSVLNIAGDSELIVKNDTANIFNGTLKGNGNLASDGDGTFTVNELDTTIFKGTFRNSGGHMYLNGLEGKDLDITIGSTSYNDDGEIHIQAGLDRTITLNKGENRSNDGGNAFNGNVIIDRGILAMDRDAEALLNDNNSQTISTLTIYGSNSEIIVDNTYKIEDLKLEGSTARFTNDLLQTNASKLVVNELTLTSGTDIYINTGVFKDNVDTRNLLDLADGIRNFVIEAESITGSSANIYDINGYSLEGETTHYLSSGGSINGEITLDTSSGVNTDTNDRPLGVYYNQDLVKVESFGGTDNVVMDGSDNTTRLSANNSATQPVTPGMEGYRTMDAYLTGEGGFTFTDNNHIIVTHSEYSDHSDYNYPDNDYQGETLIDMSSEKTGVYLSGKNVFGETDNLNIQKGTVYMNGQELTAGAVNGTRSGYINFDMPSQPGVLNINGKSGLDSNGEFLGQVYGYGTINMNGTNSQSFANASNGLTGAINQYSGTLSWAGRLTSTGGANALNVFGGDFIQNNSRIKGNVLVNGSTATFGGEGKIDGNLTIENYAAYMVTTTSGTLDKTTVTGTATFAETSDLRFSNEAKGWLLKNPGNNATELLNANDLVINSSNWKDGVLSIDMGILGSATITQRDDKLIYQGIDTPTNPKKTIIESWAQEGINVSDVVGRSNIGDVIVDTVTKYLWNDTDAIANDNVVNARFANAEFMGHVIDSTTRFTKKEVLSVFNYDSGYTATLPVQATLDTARSFGQGLKNRINNLRAARTIMADMYSGFGYYQPMGAYGNSIVQDAFGYGAPAYLGTAYYDPYTGMTQGGAPMQAQQYGYGYNYGFEQQQPVYGYGQQYVPGYASTNIWAGGVGSWTKQKTSKGGIGGYTYDQGGVMVGIDHIAGDFLFGVAFGYSYGKLEDKESISSDSKIHAYAANLYADYNHESGVNAMLFGGFAWTQNKINRTVAGYRDRNSDGDVGGLYSDHGREKTKYDGHAMYLGTNVSYDWLPTDRLTVSPSIGVEYYQARGKAHDRELIRNSGVVLSDHISAVRGHSLSAPIDVTVTYDVVRSWDAKLSLIANAGYAYEFHNKGPKGHLTWNDVVDSPVVSFDGRKPGRSGWNFGGGARFQKKNFSVDVKYDFAHRKDVTTHRVGANIGWEF